MKKSRDLTDRLVSRGERIVDQIRHTTSITSDTINNTTLSDGAWVRKHVIEFTKEGRVMKLVIETRPKLISEQIIAPKRRLNAISHKRQYSPTQTTEKVELFMRGDMLEWKQIELD